MYKLVLSREAERFYRRADRPVATRLRRAFESLEQDPRAGNNVKRLTGRLSGAYRYRVGDLRIVYSINDEQVIVFVITIAHRRNVYD